MNPTGSQGVSFGCKEAQKLYDAYFKVLTSIATGDFSPEQVAQEHGFIDVKWKAGGGDSDSTIWSFLSFMARGGRPDAEESGALLVEEYPRPQAGRSASLASSGALVQDPQATVPEGPVRVLHVSDLPISAKQIYMKPTVRELLIAGRDILAGDIWMGGSCKAHPTRESGAFSWSYLGATAVSAYGVALSTLAFMAALLSRQGILEEIPEAVRHAATAIQVEVGSPPADFASRLAQQLDACGAASALNRKVTDWDLLDALADLEAETGLSNPEALLAAYATQVKSKTDRQLDRNSKWRLTNLRDPEKFCAGARKLVARWRQMHDEGGSGAPVDFTMRNSGQFYCKSRSKKGSSFLAELTEMTAEAQTFLVARRLLAAPVPKWEATREMCVLMSNLDRLQVFKQVGLSEESVAVLKTAFTSDSAFDTRCLEGFVARADTHMVQHGVHGKPKEMKHIQKVVADFPWVVDKLREQDAARSLEEAQKKAALTQADRAARLGSIKSRLQDELHVATVAFEQYRCLGDTVKGMQTLAEQERERKLEEDIKRHVRHADVQTFKGADQLREAVDKAVTAMKGKIVADSTSSHADVLTVWILDARTRGSADKKLFEEVGKLLRSAVVAASDLILFFNVDAVDPNSKEDNWQPLAKVKYEVLQAIMGEDWDSFEPVEFTVERAGNQRRLQGPAVSFGTALRKAQKTVHTEKSGRPATTLALSEGARIWDAAEMVSSNSIKGVAWPYEVWAPSEECAAQGDEDAEGAAVSAAPGEAEPGTGMAQGHRIKFGFLNPRDKKAYRGVAFWRALMSDVVQAAGGQGAEAAVQATGRKIVLFVDLFAAFGDSLEAALTLQRCGPQRSLNAMEAGVSFIGFEKSERMFNVLNSRRARLLREFIGTPAASAPWQSLQQAQAKAVSDLNGNLQLLSFHGNFELATDTRPNSFSKQHGIVADLDLMSLLASANEAFGGALFESEQSAAVTVQRTCNEAPPGSPQQSASTPKEEPDSEHKPEKRRRGQTQQPEKRARGSGAAAVARPGAHGRIFGSDDPAEPCARLDEDERPLSELPGDARSIEDLQEEYGDVKVIPRDCVTSESVDVLVAVKEGEQYVFVKLPDHFKDLSHELSQKEPLAFWGGARFVSEPAANLPEKHCVDFKISKAEWVVIVSDNPLPNAPASSRVVKFEDFVGQFAEDNGDIDISKALIGHELKKVDSKVVVRKARGVNTFSAQLDHCPHVQKWLQW